MYIAILFCRIVTPLVSTSYDLSFCRTHLASTALVQMSVDNTERSLFYLKVHIEIIRKNQKSQIHFVRASCSCRWWDWLIDYLRFYAPFKNFSLIQRCHHCWWRAAKFSPMLSAQGLWAGRDLHRATPAVTRDLGFSGLIWRTAQFSRLLRHTRGCGGSILARIVTGSDGGKNWYSDHMSLLWGIKRL
jgi:hypothetical protein